jgi:hypothetical protein
VEEYFIDMADVHSSVFVLSQVDSIWYAKFRRGSSRLHQHGYSEAAKIRLRLDRFIALRITI